MLPQRFLERMQGMLGEEYPAFFAQYEKEHAQALRVNTQKADPERFLRQATFRLRPIPWSPAGYYYESGDAPGKHPYHAAGVYYIQEPSAQAPAEYLMQKLTDIGEFDSDDERILDLCAAPGGKSTQVAAAMRGHGILVCNEIHPARAKILSENIERMGICNAVVTNESPERLAEHFGMYFTRILVDAPCSGEGMFRKNDTACEEWSEEQVKLCAARQDGILAQAASMLLPGGRLVYSTCTFAPEENEGSILRFLRAHPDFYIEEVEKRDGMSDGVPEWGEQPDVPGGWQERPGQSRETAAGWQERPGQSRETAADGLSATIRLWPHRLDGEGHYLAVLRRRGGGAVSGMPAGYGSCGRQRGINAKDAAKPGRGLVEYRAFAAETLCGQWAGEQSEDAGRYLLFGDQLYRMPEGMPSLAGLKVLRPGLHLGTVKKNRFEPAHALALASSPDDVRNVAAFSSDGEEIRRYLAGETLPWDGQKGWTAVTVDGYTAGWGKTAGGCLKNHYPRGLRIPR